jgi:hypothetical protein
MKKPCGRCPYNGCKNCPVDPVTIEEAAIKSAENMGPAEKLWIPDPETGEQVFVDMKNPSAEAMVLLEKLFGEKKDV